MRLFLSLCLLATLVGCQQKQMLTRNQMPINDKGWNFHSFTDQSCAGLLDPNPRIVHKTALIEAPDGTVSTASSAAAQNEGVPVAAIKAVLHNAFSLPVAAALIRPDNNTVGSPTASSGATATSN